MSKAVPNSRKKQFSPAPLALAIVSSFSLFATGAHAQQHSSDDGHEHTDPTEVIVITASPLKRTQLDSAQPVSVLAADELRKKNAHTLGETLSQEPGINNTHFANVAGSPIIRGLDGPRVKITQNGLDSADVSRGSPDHAVTTETSTAQQVEVFRGPATLLYGSGAIGGVVNVVDNRIATQQVDGVTGSYNVSADTASDRREGSAAINAGHDLDDGQLVFHLDVFARDSENYEVPSFTNDEGETTDVVDNSFIEAEGATVGVSYVTDTSYLGFSVGRIEQNYGIPGHEHAHEDDHADEHIDDGDDHHAHEDEMGPFAELTQNRYQVLGGWEFADSFIQQVELKLGFTDYQHSEIEDNIAATTFSNEQSEARLTLRHAPLAGWDGALGVHWYDSEQQAIGEEAYTPNSDTRRTALFWVGEQQFGDFNWQLGGRFERVDTETDNGFQNDFNAWSASAGFTYPLTDTLSFAANISHAQRAPTAAELYSNGAHFATRTYEVGLAYAAEETSVDHVHIDPVARDIEQEVSNNIDLGLHYEVSDFHAQFNLFYNRVDDYVYGSFTGFDSEMLHLDDHGHGDEHADEHADEHDHAHGDALPVIAYEQRDVELFGYELELGWNLTDNWQLNAFSDFTRARLRDGGDLPRIPAQRIGAEVVYAQTQWDASLGYTYTNEQNRVEVNESTTDSYGLLNATASYYPNWGSSQNLALYMKADNLTDELGFVHTSFLKEDAPVRGRNVSIGLRGEF